MSLFFNAQRAAESCENGLVMFELLSCLFEIYPHDSITLLLVRNNIIFIFTFAPFGLQGSNAPRFIC